MKVNLRCHWLPLEILIARKLKGNWSKTLAIKRGGGNGGREEGGRGTGEGGGKWKARDSTLLIFRC